MHGNGFAGAEEAMPALAARSEDAFDPARHSLERMVGFLRARESWTMTHSELERWIEKEGREVMRQLLQGHLELRGPAEAGGGGVGGAGGPRRGLRSVLHHPRHRRARKWRTAGHHQ